MAPPETDLGHWVKYTGDLIPKSGRHSSGVKALAFALSVKTGGKERFTLEEDYGVQLHVVDYNLECSFFSN